jgi:predicted MFS family arabinose efflux permease
MLSVSLLAMAGNWQMAAVLIVLERVGKATRNRPRDMLRSHTANEMGYGWVFGVHEILDQCGALFGPLVAATVLALRGEYRVAFAVLLIPALVALSILIVARLTHPRSEETEASPLDMRTTGLPGVFWVYLQGVMLVAGGFVDFPLIAYHFARTLTMSGALIPVFYAVAMGMSGMSSFVFGRLFDRVGISVLIPVTLISALFAPFVFLGNFWMTLVGVALWGLGIGVHESIIPAAVARLVPAQRHDAAYGIFTLSYGVFWFTGSAILGILYGKSLPALIAFSLIAELAAIPLFLLVRSQHVG